jgi:molybdate transport system substrate-binding protein
MLFQGILRDTDSYRTGILKDAGFRQQISRAESVAMRIGFGKLMIVSAVVVAALVGLLMFWQPGSPSTASSDGASFAPATAAPKKTLLVYCAAGLQPVMSEIQTAYEASHPAQLELQIAGSGSLLSSIVVGGGDVFLAADRLYLNEASQKHVAPEIVPLAYQFPVIVVRKGNPKHVTSLNDLLKPDIRVALADPDRAAIGKVVRIVLTREELWDPLWKKAVTHEATVNEVALKVKLVGADAGIVWNTTASQLPDLDVIRVPEFDRAKGEIAVGLLSSSKDPQAALDLIHYIADPNQGLRVFARMGYEVVTPKPKAAH